MAAEWVRSYRDGYGSRIVHIYKCSGCGKEIEVFRKIPGMDTYCGKCTKERTIKKKEMYEAKLIEGGVRKVLEGYIPRLKGALNAICPAEQSIMVREVIADMEKRINDKCDSSGLE